MIELHESSTEILMRGAAKLFADPIFIRSRPLLTARTSSNEPRDPAESKIAFIQRLKGILGIPEMMLIKGCRAVAMTANKSRRARRSSKYQAGVQCSLHAAERIHDSEEVLTIPDEEANRPSPLAQQNAVRKSCSSD